MNQMMLLAETEMRTTLNYGRKNYVSPEAVSYTHLTLPTT